MHGSRNLSSGCQARGGESREREKCKRGTEEFGGRREEKCSVSLQWCWLQGVYVCDYLGVFYCRQIISKVHLKN